MSDSVPEQFREKVTRRRLEWMMSSYEWMLGMPLVVPNTDPVDALWTAPKAILAHGAEADPLFFFANRSALRAFEADLETMIGLPSRLSAEAPLREERQTLLERVSKEGFIDDYQGIRIALTGRRFRIENAVVWNIVDETGQRHGQAAAFAI